MASKEKAQYAPPASQVDLDARIEDGNASTRELSTSETYKGNTEESEHAPYEVEGNDVSQYIGTDPVYANYANDTEAPLAVEGDDNPEGEIFDNFVKSSLPGPLKVEGNVEHEGAKEAAEEAKKASEAARAEQEESGTTTDSEPETAPGGNPDADNK